MSEKYRYALEKDGTCVIYFGRAGDDVVSHGVAADTESAKKIVGVMNALHESESDLYKRLVRVQKKLEDIAGSML